MANLFVFNEEVETQDHDKITFFLERFGIRFGKVELPDQAKELAKLQTLTDEQRSGLIDLFPEEIDKFSSLTGYRSDVVCFYPGFEHLDFILSKFAPIHFHFENEFWYFVDGSAKFGYLGHDGTKFQVTVEAGEFIQVPEGVWQWFELTEEKRMKAIRFFYTTGTVPERVPVEL
ncbi:cupin domain-containing protein [Laceyella tengchongensis]|jgi:1,2-dihydroxy-3-keto-5-methylthiopentene dioxygenase|nr:TheB [Laceyella sacchari]